MLLVIILNFMGCLWKARNDYLFNRKKATPHQVNIAATSLSNDFCDLLNSSSHHQPQNSSCILTHTNQLLLQGQTLKSDLLITGPKVYTDAAFKCKKKIQVYCREQQPLELVSTFFAGGSEGSQRADSSFHLNYKYSSAG